MEGGIQTINYTVQTITVLLINSWDGRGVRTIHYSTITNPWYGRGVQTINYSTITNPWDGRGVQTINYSTITNPWDGRGVQTIQYSTITNLWDGRGVQTINYSTINQLLGWEGGPDHKLQYQPLTKKWGEFGTPATLPCSSGPPLEYVCVC